MFNLAEINWLAVLAATVAHQVIGFLWYGPLFGSAWMRAIGRQQDELAEGATRAIVIATVAALIMATAFALLLTIGEQPSLTNGIVWGVVLAIGFVGTTQVINGAFERRTWTVTALFVVYEVIALAVMGAILGAWR